jgi:hypothetical protein
VGQDKAFKLLPHFVGHLRELDGDAETGTPTRYDTLDG